MNGRDDIHIHIDLNGLENRLDRINHHLQQIHQLIQQSGEQVMSDLTRLTSEVEENTTVVGSAITLLGELADLIRAAGTDQAALDDLANTLDAQSNALAAAVEANTPAGP